ncbi:hypothetical protein PABG_12216 [Paracoccidioides brasiliensis Pb03]|uniref:Uncharacterized protein n=1 Tax=Paracoccidioides brasiliensis (strain Pb18) TaxID=502780 RepID=A0A0A0HV34_PARBD|nr:uncharacterized protein PADG_12038 [Paracoccidioides brasiliensis Pb18]KGM91896.1 hypothetical protein PADG_12038 [Paracoccidioides brasiliensis Pb18]KGY14938.1 hypothetical protein PABG_12216 [Paracoccidioides brasiliensis Pb03]
MKGFELGAEVVGVGKTLIYTYRWLFAVVRPFKGRLKLRTSAAAAELRRSQVNSKQPQPIKANRVARLATSATLGLAARELFQHPELRIPLSQYVRFLALSLLRKLLYDS